MYLPYEPTGNHERRGLFGLREWFPEHVTSELLEGEGRGIPGALRGETATEDDWNCRKGGVSKKQEGRGGLS